MIPLNTYKNLLNEAADNNIIVREVSLKSKSDGLYKDGKIAINKDRLITDKEKACILAEEMGHHFTTRGNIINLEIEENRKQEYKARCYAYDKIASIKLIIEVIDSENEIKKGIVERLGITEKFFNEAIEYHKTKL